MRRIILIGSCFIGALLMGGLPLIERDGKTPVPNYQIHENGSISPLQQSGNLLLNAGAESSIRYDRSQLNQIDRERRGLSTKP